MKALEYQQKYIVELETQANKYLHDQFRTSSVIIFKAPTGSGKTYMISQSLMGLVKSNAGKASYAFMWISVNSLHEQSRLSLIRYLDEERLLDCIGIEDIQNSTIGENQIVFINWESLIKENNIFRTENERNWNLTSVIENTKDDGKQIILIIDESHRTAKAEKAQDIIKEISPILTIEMTATPTSSITGHTIDIPLGEVIAEGMIKKEIHINDAAGKITQNDELLDLALRKRKELHNEYARMGKDINPLLLIQVPNKKSGENLNPEEYMVGLLSERGLSVKAGNLAIWLSDTKENKDLIELNDSPVEVLVFKEAIALGWDCPRAAILFLQREWNKERYEFNIQTLGRIMRMPEQTHYEDKTGLNYGYVYSASDNFTIVQELASDYATNIFLHRDEDVYKPVYLLSEFIRRKREQTRLSGEFKKCLYEALQDSQYRKEINLKVSSIKKQIGINGVSKELDSDQQISFADSKLIEKNEKEIFDSYTKFCVSMCYPFSQARSSVIIKSSIRAMFKDVLGIDNEDKIATILMHPSNNAFFTDLIEKAKEKYKNIPPRETEVIPKSDWEIPDVIGIFIDTEIIPKSKKSIMKLPGTNSLYAKKDKKGKLVLSTPEQTFIDELEKTDDDVLWWFKNSHGESKYFGIAYKKRDGQYYNSYPDFIIRTKKETYIVEIKDDRDFKLENALKLQAGKDYIKRIYPEGGVRFWMLSPQDYFNFFKSLKEQNIEGFHSSYERNLTKLNLSQKLVLESKQDRNESESERLDFLSDFELTLQELDQLKEYNSILEQSLEEAQGTIIELTKSYGLAQKNENQKLKEIRTPFNICILGEVSNQQTIIHDLNQFFNKLGISTTSWSVEFYDNRKIKQTKTLKTLIEGQSRFNLLITGQLHTHNLPGNSKGNLLSELRNAKYVEHIVGCEPSEVLTSDKLISALYTLLIHTNPDIKVEL